MLTSFDFGLCSSHVLQLYPAKTEGLLCSPQLLALLQVCFPTAEQGEQTGPSPLHNIVTKGSSITEATSPHRAARMQLAATEFLPKMTFIALWLFCLKIINFVFVLFHDKSSHGRTICQVRSLDIMSEHFNSVSRYTDFLLIIVF